MSERVGGVRSVSFPPTGSSRPKAQAPPPEPAAKPAPEFTKVNPPTNPLVSYQRLAHDNKLVHALLKGLGGKESELHGDLQVILSAVRRMETVVKALLEGLEQ